MEPIGQIENDGIRLVLASQEVDTAMDEARQMVRLQRMVGWKGEEVPTHTLRSFSLGAVTGLIDLGYLLLAKSEKGEVLGFARVAAAGTGLGTGLGPGTGTRLGPGTGTRLGPGTGPGPGLGGTRRQHYLHELAVSTDIQLKGLGKRLMNGVVEESRRRGAHALLFTFNALNPRNAFFYLEKCRARGLRLLADFYGKPVDGKAFVLFSCIDLNEFGNPPNAIHYPDIPVVAQPAQFNGQALFKVPVPPQAQDFLAFDHPLTQLIDKLLLGLLANGTYTITGYHRSRNHFWIVSRLEA